MSETVSETKPPRWLPLIPWGVGIIAYLLVRYRGEWEAYLSLHRAIKGAGVPDAVRNLDSLFWYILAALLGSYFVTRHVGGSVLKRLTINEARPGGLWMAQWAVAPMVFGGWAWSAYQNADLGEPGELIAGLLSGVIRPALGEEILFRGLLVAVPAVAFGWSGRAFWRNATLASLFFGAIHAPWNAAFFSAWGAILVTFAGGMWYSWLLSHWRSLWVPIVLHAGMNLGWMLIGAAGGAAGGGWLANGLRVATIVIGTVMTLKAASGRGAPGTAISKQDSGVTAL